MAMPEAAMDEHHRSPPLQNDIGSARDTASVNAKTQPVTMQEGADRDFEKS